MRISDWSSDVCSSDLILIGLVAMLAQRRLMPAWTVFAAATDIGQHVHAALTEPATADAGAVIGRQRNLETAVAVQQRRVVAIALERFGRDHEIRQIGRAHV